MRGKLIAFVVFLVILIAFVIIWFLAIKPFLSHRRKDDSNNDGENVMIKSGDKVRIECMDKYLSVCGSSGGVQGGCENCTGDDFNVVLSYGCSIDVSSWHIYKILEGKKAPNGTPILPGDDVSFVLRYGNTTGFLQICGDVNLRTTSELQTIGYDPSTVFTIDFDTTECNRTNIYNGDNIVIENQCRYLSAGNKLDGICEGKNQCVLENKINTWKLYV